MEKHTAKGLSIGIIMDGNGRWAKQRGLPRTAGHKKGAEVFEDIFQYAIDQGAKAVTFYAFSTENWVRPRQEVDYLMGLLETNLQKLVKRKYENNRVIFLGEKSQFRPSLVRVMEELEADSREKTGTCLMVALNYGGRAELARAAREIAAAAVAGDILPQDVDEACISQYLYTAGQPDPDFIIRTSGEKRLSNFLIWQAAYAEYIYTDLYWPDFTREAFDAAVEEFYRRGRRFGGVENQ